MREIVKEVTVRATPDVVWRAITDAEELRRWFPIDARVQPGVGGSIWVSWGEGAEAEAPITGWDPPRHLQWTQDRGPVKLFVDFHIEAAAGGSTVVRLVQSGFGDGPEWDDEFHMTDGGWTYFMAHLGWYINRHHGVPRDVLALREPVTLSRGEAFARLTHEFENGGSAPALAESRNTQQLALRLPALNDGVLFLEMEPHPDGCRAGFYLSTYGLSPDRLKTARNDFETRYRRALDLS